MNSPLQIGFSPCPNDTFMMDALVNQKLSVHPFNWMTCIDDVETLNRKAIEHELDVTKLSFAAYAFTSATYQILSAGSALGWGCGPMLIALKEIDVNHLPDLVVAIPGKYTTANLLLSILFPEIKNKVEMKFEQIEGAVLNGEADLGLIIHENRFTYAAKGLRKFKDLGELWEKNTGYPIPLGCIAVKRSLPESLKAEVYKQLKMSVQFALENPTASSAFVNEYAREMDPGVQQMHIQLYVNQYSVDLGVEGRAAVDFLFQKGNELGLLPKIEQPLFYPESI